MAKAHSLCSETTEASYNHRVDVGGRGDKWENSRKYPRNTDYIEFQTPY